MSSRLIAIVLNLSLLFTSCISFSDGIPEPHGLQYQPSFDLLAKDITNQNVIFELDDFTRDHKSLNGISVYLGKVPEPIDTLGIQGTNRIHESLDKVLDSLNIDKHLLNNFQKRLKDTKLRSFYKSGDTVLFIVDGFLNDAWGFMYSSGTFDSIPESFRFGGYTVSLLDSINSSWRRAAIH